MPNTIQKPSGLSVRKIGWNILSLLGTTAIMFLMLFKPDEVAATNKAPNKNSSIDLAHKNVFGNLLPSFDSEHENLYADHDNTPSAPREWSNKNVRELFRIDQHITRENNAKVNPAISEYLKQGYYLIYPSMGVIGSNNPKKPEQNKQFTNPDEIVVTNDFAYHNPRAGRICVDYVSDTQLNIYNFTLTTENGLKFEKIHTYNVPKDREFFNKFITQTYTGLTKTRGVFTTKLVNPNNFEMIEVPTYLPTKQKSSNDQSFFQNVQAAALKERLDKNPEMTIVFKNINTLSKQIAKDNTLSDIEKKTQMNFLEIKADELASAYNKDPKQHIKNLEKIVENFESDFMRFTGSAKIPEKISQLREKISEKIAELKQQKHPFDNVKISSGRKMR